jgi:TIR domain
MAYVPSFQHDVFISYAHADNGSTKRVSAFHQDLVQRLTTRLGARAFHKPQEWVFFDRVGLKAGDEFSPKLERSARRSAVLISLVSPSYLQAPYCVQETEWFLESKRLARDPIERRLVPIVLNHTDEGALRQFPQFATDLLRGSLCTASTTYEAGSAGWNDVLETLAHQIADHLRDARQKHGAVYVGQACKAAESFRAGLVEELRAFLCVPEYAIFKNEAAVRQALAEAKLAVHFLGGSGAEVVDRAEAILMSLDHCPGKTVGYLPPGQELAEDERLLIEQIRNHPQWTRPECTPTELAQILTRELESFRLPDPSTPIAVACDKPDLITVQRMAREIHTREAGAFAVGTPDFLAEPSSLAFIAWKKLLTKSPSVVVYWGEGQKQYLDANIARYLPAAKLGRAWYVSLVGPETEAKRGWQPSDLETEKIMDEDQVFTYDRLREFLQRVLERARQ